MTLDEELAAAIRDDHRIAPISEQDHAMLEFVEN